MDTARVLARVATANGCVPAHTHARVRFFRYTFWEAEPPPFRGWLGEVGSLSSYSVLLPHPLTLVMDDVCVCLARPGACVLPPLSVTAIADANS